MISVRKAQQKILDTVPAWPPVTVPLKEAVSRYVAETIRSPIDMPSFDNSAMDGYALRSADTRNASQEQPVLLQLTKAVAAGDDPSWELQSGEAARIFTGAMVPAGADAVIEQEAVRVQDNGILIHKAVPEGSHIRWHGEELCQGDLVLQEGDPITAAGIGLLASLGIQNIEVYSPVRIGIVVTGSEIVTKPSDFTAGKIFDSNSFALSAALRELFLTPSFVRHCPDEKAAVQQAITAGFEESDFLIVTGGVSVGDYDFVKEVAKDHGIEEIFWRVKQKPGKPLFFGKKGESQFLFGLPGNPASALVCYYEYVRIALLRALGSHSPLLPQTRFPLRNTYSKKGGRRHFLRARLLHGKNGTVVEILEKQGSHMMGSFAHASCLAVIPADAEEINQGEMVEVHLLPSFFTVGGDEIQ